MQLVNAHVYPMGTFLLGKDRKDTLHGIFCWSAEQIALIARDWRLSFKDELRLAKLFMAEMIDTQSRNEPQLVHGIGAGLIEEQFALLKNVRDITKPGTTVPLEQGRIYARTQSLEERERDAALLLYITPEGEATLAHVRTQDQAAEILIWEDWMRENGYEIIVGTMKTLPRYDRFNQHPMFIHGSLVEQLITAQVIYKQFFPEDSTARN
ncbi:hypothetical protein A3C09_00675 [Candidatus Uhrbacteria bacterium RIFCSPHIGHO2_02_FULL_47_44]|uniref:Uncharacterized protein n=1 Tax=Candidatus Uhrbacteria bacterium RIFCSPLOWO2_02_FULL_48_18 TaxID=1802408 RepID=A0A1F7V9C1_9BACT|nr:MAG: hypothetical protein A3C09_00675 [Candidatus Uhrbacteria bacterium RIFCSPHIGHO2_02_FULL_47_44]OGL81852.1 MAG: hypothetical protein A3B20_02045 [Candidatus Uhrbacteria bacterium RIFCSPLOWO2_01_FULL_47_17]OGL87015.1 MAG: hypothetical protein A3I41_03635 [Candidatus Uhrbacteria bacterium RIFCSPLOWO2_02_FULL_48_18]OGL94485.1 MAG: hypothetical protein A3H12_00220 [Candidatus Uhrbacteria bacterium RIFCSPLOWO2_12_FULL_47_9]